MQCQKCGFGLGYRDKFCQNCGGCLAKDPKHFKLVMGIGLIVALLSAISIGFIFYILYSVLVWNIFT